MSEIQIQTTGHLTADVDLTYTPSGQAVAKFRVAVTPRKRQGDGWVDGETTFVSCEAWGDLGEHIAESLSRGSQVFLSGVLRTQRWQDKQNGSDRERLFVRVDEIGPSLRFATARPQKARRVEADRREGGLPSATPADADPWATAQGTVAQQLGGTEVPSQDAPF